jgi:hypothetical protein
MDTTVVRLIWEGPYAMRDFLAPTLRDHFDCAGVYLRIERFSGTERLSYVGKASGTPSLYVRQQQHYAHAIGGLYSIPKDFRADGKLWDPKWGEPDVNDVLLDLTRYQRLVRDAFNWASACTVYLARLPAQQAEDVERQLLYDLRPTMTRRGTKGVPAKRISIVHEDATWSSDPIRQQVRDHVVFASQAVAADCGMREAAEQEPHRDT